MHALSVISLIGAVAQASPSPQMWGGSWGNYEQTTAVVVDDGDPHQKYVYKQLSVRRRPSTFVALLALTASNYTRTPETARMDPVKMPITT